MRSFGYLRSHGPLGVPTFQQSQTLVGLASANPTDQYLIPCQDIPVFDQGSLNTCVANSTVFALMLLMRQTTGGFQTLSRLFTYWNARLYTRATNVDKGTFIHDAFSGIGSIGVCPESTWPYDSGQVFAQPPVEAYREGSDNTIAAFYEIQSFGDQRLADIELAVRANHPVVFGANVGNDFEHYNGDPSIVFNPPAQTLGGHAQAIIGIRTNQSGKKEFLVRNSWSEGWGIDGCSWWSADYITDVDTSDLFVPTKVPGLMV